MTHSEQYFAVIRCGQKIEDAHRIESRTSIPSITVMVPKLSKTQRTELQNIIIIIKCHSHGEESITDKEKEKTHCSLYYANCWSRAIEDTSIWYRRRSLRDCGTIQRSHRGPVMLAYSGTVKLIPMTLAIGLESLA